MADNGREVKAKGQERVKSQGPKTESNESRAEDRGPRAEKQVTRTEGCEPRVENEEPYNQKESQIEQEYGRR